MSEKTNERLLAWGIAFAIMGINTAAVLKLLIGSSTNILSIMVMLLALLLLINYGRGMRFYGINAEAGVMFAYSVFTIILSVVAKYKGTELPGQFEPVYQVFYLLEILALWNNNERLNSKRVLKTLYYLSVVISVAFLILILLNMVKTGNVLFNTLGTDSEGKGVVTRASTAQAAFITFAATITYREYIKNRLEKIANDGALAVSTILLIISTRRSVYIMFIAMLIMLMWDKGLLKKYVDLRKFKLIVYSVVAVVAVVALAAIASPKVYNVLENVFNFFINGIKTYLGTSKKEDMAASIRMGSLDEVKENYFHNSSISEILFGRGYMTKWVDIPIAQAIYDLGAIGGLFYIIAGVIVPIKYVLKKQTEPILIFAQCLVLQIIFNNVSSGCPYGVFLPIIFMVLLAKREKEKINEDITD